MLSWLVVALTCVGTQAKAQQTTLPLASDAMPGVETVPFLGQRVGLLDVGAGLQYGYTDSVLSADDRHHRAALGLAAATSLIPHLLVGLQLNAHYDGHFGGATAPNDNSLQLRPRLTLRTGLEVTDGLHLGLQGALSPAPTASVGDAVAGTGVQADAIATHSSDDLTLSARVGMGVDGGRKATKADTLSSSDRLALAIGDPPEVRIGLGGMYRLSSVALVTEATWDIPVGKNAVGAFEAPIWLRLGARLPLSDGLQLGAMLGVSPSARPTLASTGPLTRVDPRFTLGVTLGGRLVPQEAPPAAPVPEVEADLGRTALRVRVVGYEGAAVAEAEVRSANARCITDEDGACEPDPRVTDAVEINVRADGYATQTVVAGPTADGQPVEIPLETLPVALQGRILDEHGEPRVNATVTLLRDDGQQETVTDADGRFTLPAMATGPATLRIEAEGITPDEREVVLMPNAEPLELSTQDEANVGQIRGTVRAFDGTPLQATIQISPRRRTLHSDENGEFAVDVPAGKYTVTVQADGYKQQRRPAVVESRGVTVILIDLGTEP